MAKIDIQVPHKLEKNVAASRIKQSIEDAQKQHSGMYQQADTEWDDNTLTFSIKVYGMSISGTLEVTEQFVHLITKLPMAATLYKGTIQEKMQEELAKVLA